LHAQWPAVIVQQLKKQLPAGYVAQPCVHFSSQIDIDVAAFEADEVPRSSTIANGSGGVATAVWAPPRSSVAVETTLPDYDEFGVRIFDARHGRYLVAAIEIVSPANNDRPEHRRIFAAKCAALLQKGVSVTIVDLVAVKHFNLYVEFLDVLGHIDPTLNDPPPDIYAASCRWKRRGEKAFLETWSHVMHLGQPLPTLPLWLSPEIAIPLNLEQSYEQACDDLSIA
jgi:hypothetical protein